MMGMEIKQGVGDTSLYAVVPEVLAKHCIKVKSWPFNVLIIVKALKISEILVTFHVSDISAMISGAEGENFFVYNYTEDQVPGILAKHLK